VRQLTAPGTVLTDQTAQAVTFVEDHDVVRDDSIVNDKMLAYAFILTHQGYPCVFWQDYYTRGLALPGDVSGIDALVRAHEDHAGGDMQVVCCDDDLYIMQRLGWQNQSGLVFVLNNRGGSWNGTTVQTRWQNTSFTPLAWRGHDLGQPLPKRSGSDGSADFWAPPRGYVVYTPGR
jgi:alpha-amylase